MSRDWILLLLLYDKDKMLNIVTGFNRKNKKKKE